MTARQREEEEARLREMLGEHYDDSYLETLHRANSTLGEKLNCKIVPVRNLVKSSY